MTQRRIVAIVTREISPSHAKWGALGPAQRHIGFRHESLRPDRAEEPPLDGRPFGAVRNGRAVRTEAAFGHRIPPRSKFAVLAVGRCAGGTLRAGAVGALADHKVLASAGSTDDGWDGGMVESFVGSFKAEPIGIACGTPEASWSPGCRVSIGSITVTYTKASGHRP
jgi:hypothetical protein